MKNESSIRFDSNADQARREAEKLATYLWENYVEPYDHEQVFFIGIGNAFHGIVKLLTDKGLLSRGLNSFPGLKLTFPQKRYTKELAEL
jgi:histone deacetylase 6